MRGKVKGEREKEINKLDSLIFNPSSLILYLSPLTFYLSPVITYNPASDIKQFWKRIDENFGF